MNQTIQNLKDGKYNVEDLVFLNMKTIREFTSKISLEDKLQILNKFNDNIASYMLDIIIKWKNEKELLPKDKWGNPKTISFIAWIKRNDLRKIIDIDYQIGSYYMFGQKIKMLDTICPTTEYNYLLEHTNEHILNQWFHDFCKQLKEKELQWFEINDPFQIKLNKVKALGNAYGFKFKCQVLHDIVYNNKKNVSEQDLDLFIETYENLEKFIDEQSKRLSEILGKEAMYKND